MNDPETSGEELELPDAVSKRRARRKRPEPAKPGEVRERVLETLRSEGFGKTPSLSADSRNSEGEESPMVQDGAISRKAFEPAAPTPTARPGPSVSAGSKSVCGIEGEALPARMLNEFVYCPRLFYYEYVEGVFVENGDTARGSAIHRRVDSGNGAMPAAKGVNDPSASTNIQDSPGAIPPGPKLPSESGERARGTGALSEDEIIHSRSVSMGSERLGVVAKMDLVEVRGARSEKGAGGGSIAGAADETADLFGLTVCPVDYKAGAPREGMDVKSELEGPQLWDTDKMQLGLQALILRDNGYQCSEGIIYYRETKQRVRLEITAELEQWILQNIAEARHTMSGPIPPPLVNSPKCVRCSLAPVCLPDETGMLAAGAAGEGGRINHPNARKGSGCGGAGESLLMTSAPTKEKEAPRRLMAAREDTRPLYLNTPGLRVGCSNEVLQVKEKEKVVQEVRLRDVSHVALFGNIQISTQAIQSLCELEVPVTYFSMGGFFYGITRGHGLKNVFLRIEQFRLAREEKVCLGLARQFVQGKIRNHRTLLMRNHLEPPEATILRLKRAAEDALAASSLEELLGIEGAAASEYFQQFGGMIKIADELSGAVEKKEQLAFNFSFANRNRRPPTDPVNAMLSLAYSMLSKDCTLAALAVGFDPYIGFYHQPRFGRPALGLDLMEEFRPLVAESTVLNCINTRVVTEKDFVRAGEAVNLTANGRKRFFQSYEQRMSSLITHPLFEYKVSYRRALELQTRLLAKSLTGEISEYIPLLTR